MPTQPAINGLPVWAQIVISLLIGVATLAVAFKGYFTKDKAAATPADPSTAAVLAATVMDMGAIRHLSDCIVQLGVRVEALTTAIDEATHFERNSVETNREIDRRLRDLLEELSRLRRP